MKRINIAFLAALVCGLMARAQMVGAKPAATPALPTQQTEPKKETPPPPPSDIRIPPEEAKRTNPVKPTDESIAAGKRLFTTQCAMCHGVEGDGKGELAIELKLKPPDWHDPATLKSRTDGALFYIITRGHGSMPGQEERLKDDQKWNLINFIRAFSKKEPAEKPKS